MSTEEPSRFFKQTFYHTSALVVYIVGVVIVELLLWLSHLLWGPDSPSSFVRYIALAIEIGFGIVVLGQIAREASTTIDNFKEFFHTLFSGNFMTIVRALRNQQPLLLLSRGISYSLLALVCIMSYMYVSEQPFKWIIIGANIIVAMIFATFLDRQRQVEHVNAVSTAQDHEAEHRPGGEDDDKDDDDTWRLTIRIGPIKAGAELFATFTFTIIALIVPNFKTAIETILHLLP